MGHVLTGGPWNLALMIKGVGSLRSSQTTDAWLLKGFRCSSSGLGLVLWFCVLGLGGKTLILGAAEGQLSLTKHFSKCEILGQH